MADYDFEQFKKDFLGGVSSAADAVSSAAKGAGDSVSRYKDFFDIGGEVAKLNNTSHGGNLSISDGKSIWITRTGVRLSRLTPGDIIECCWDASDCDLGASMELVVHREVYHALARKAQRENLAFETKAIIHAHCLYTNFLSLNADKIVPIDSEGQLLIKEASVLATERTVASAEVGLKLAELAENGTNIAIIRSHGPFAIGDNLEQALQLLSSLEYSAHLLSLLGITKNQSSRELSHE